MTWRTCTLTSTSQAPGQEGSMALAVVLQNWWKETRWQEQPRRKKGAPRRTHGNNHAKGNWSKHWAMELFAFLPILLLFKWEGNIASPKTARWTKSPTVVEPDPSAWNQEQTSVKVNGMRTGLSRSGLALLSHMSPWYLGKNRSLVLYMQWYM